MYRLKTLKYYVTSTGKLRDFENEKKTGHFEYDYRYTYTIQKHDLILTI